MFRFFESIADTLPSIKSIKREILKHPRRGKVIDIGCGTGRNTALMTSFADKVVGIDFDESKIIKARVRFPNVEFYHLDAANTPFGDREFDTAFMIMFLHEACTEGVMKEVSRISRELVIVDYSRIQYGLRKKLVRVIEGDKFDKFSEINLVTKFTGYGFVLKESRRIHQSLYVYHFINGKSGSIRYDAI
ncbi:MAG: class I SAM-dependent methyltransferase [Bacillota bacterium]